MKTLYNQFGKPLAYFDNDNVIFSFSGDALAYLYEDKIYLFEGTHIGWYIDGWIRDLNGFCAFFDESSTGGPSRPVKGVSPTKSIKRIVPIKSVRKLPGIKPVKRLAWSYNSNLAFFK